MTSFLACFTPEYFTQDVLQFFVNSFKVIDVLLLHVAQTFFDGMLILLFVLKKIMIGAHF